MIAEPIIKDWVIPQGVDYPIRMRYMADNDTPVDLSGAIVRGAVKRTFSAENAITFTLGNGKAYLDTVTGFFGLNIVAADSTALEATSYVYDIEVVLPSGDTTRAMQGKITLTPEVTK